MKYIKEYVNKINTGEIVACKRLKKIYNKILNQIENGIYLFSQERADKARDFIENFCRHSKGEWAGQLVELILFQKAFISVLFGVIDKDTGLRLFKEVFFYVARKNGKSTFLSGIAIYMQIADGEPGAEIYAVASKKDQAKIIFNECHNMIKQDPYLRKHIKKRKSDLYFNATLSKMEALGRNSDSLDGLNSHMVVIDELHTIKDRNLYEVLQQSMSARREPILFMITTSGFIRENIFDDIYEYACNVVDEVFEDKNFLPIIYELDDKKEWLEPDAWEKSNPGLRTIKKIEDLKRKVENAKNDKKLLPGLLTKDFNIRENSNVAWLSFQDINNTETFDIETFKGGYCIGGADLSITTDLTCATILLMDKEKNKRYIYQMYWIPKDRLEERVKLDKIPYDIWYRQGLLRLCEGNTIDYSDVTQWFLEVVNELGITPLWIYYDSYSAKYWVQEMESHGFIMERCIQNYKTLSLPMQNLGAELETKRVIYNNNPILKWCLSNTGINVDKMGNIMPIKSQSSKQRIDGTASLLNCYVGLFENYDKFLDAF